MSRSIFATTLFSLCLLAPIGCAVTSENASEEEQVDENQDALTSTAQSLVGSYYQHQVSFGGIGRLTLESNGKYHASVDPKGTAVCVTSPCLIPEHGNWNATKSTNGTLRLRLRASGQASRYYQAKLANHQLTLTQNGQSQTLYALGNNQCLDDSDCSVNQECGPRFCLMYCQVNDPFCCGPSTCQAKTPPPPPPPPPPSCFGAWKDQNGLCRTPADGVYPDSCCAGEACGPSTCAVGEVCCNPLSGICTAPGMACAF